MSSLREPHMVGSVRVGTPDDYVMRFMPSILARFAQTYPMVQVELHCEPSFHLLQRKDLDLTIVTREPGKEIGQLLRQEQIVWAQAAGFDLNEQSSLPLAMFNAECFCRDWACNALDTMGRDYRVAYTSPSLSAIMAVVSAGLAITAQLQSLIPADMRILGVDDGLPSMPSASIVLLRNAQTRSPVSECLADYIADGFRL
jgi:DNA-binding transcriptional LysR family regulator